MPESLLLDDRRISGQHAVLREFGPALQTLLVDADDLQDGVRAVAHLSELWGGGHSVLLPMRRGDTGPNPDWDAVFDDGHTDEVAARTLLGDIVFDARLRGLPVRADAFAEPIWSVIAGQREQPADWESVHAELPDPDDPWFAAYAASFGILPERPNRKLLEWAGVRPDVEFDELLAVRRQSVEHPDGQDLLRRLREPGHWSPRTLSLFGLGIGAAPWSQDLALSPTWTNRHWTRQLVGSNIVVVYEPGSVDDLCLLWTLIAAHGLRKGFPLGLPVCADVSAELSRWYTVGSRELQFAPKLRGFGRPFALTSLSVDAGRLAAIAEEAGSPWRSFAAADLLQGPRRPAVRSTEVASFVDGEAVIDAWDATSRAMFTGRSSRGRGTSFRSRIIVQERPLPPLGTLRASDRALSPAWRDGGFDSHAPDQGQPLRVHWPHGFNVLRAAAQEHGLRVRPSRPGLAAQACLNRIGSLRELDPLKVPWMLHRLDLLAERGGISWFRTRMRDLTAAAGHDVASVELLRRIEEHVRQLAVSAGSEEHHDLTFGPVSGPLGAGPARTWLSWAEDRGLLVRGVEVRCPTCKAKGWRTTAEMAPPIGCYGCGQTIRHPFPADHVQFRYRASQVLLNVMQAGALSHLLCASWWGALFDRGYLYGLHPGLEFLDDDENVLGEVDLVLLLEDGRLALGECKSRSAGLTQHDIDGLETLADRLDAAWTFYATPQWAAECAPIWQQLRRDLPGRRRFALTGEHLLAQASEVRSLLGVDVTAFEPWDETAIADHAQRFRDGLPETIDRLERPRGLDDWLLPEADRGAW